MRLAHATVLVVALAGNACAVLYDFSGDDGVGANAGASGSDSATVTDGASGPAQGATAPSNATASGPSSSASSGSGCGFCAPTVDGQVPFLRVEGGDEVVACPAGHDMIAQAFGDVAFDDFECGCACGAPPTCSAFIASGTSCSFTANDAALAAGVCTPYAFGTSVVAFLEAGPTAPCTGIDEVKAAPTPAPRENVAFCSATDACDGGTCFETAASACIGVAVGTACPGEYPVEHVYATATVDQRACTGCLCATTNPGCEGALHVFDGSGACSIGTATIGVGQCTTGAVATGTVRYEPNIAPACAPQTSHPAGTVELDAATAIRVCCAG